MSNAIPQSSVSTPEEVSDHGYLTSSFYVEESCPPPPSVAPVIVPFSKIPTTLDPVQTSHNYTTTQSGVTAEHYDMTTQFRIPINTVATTTTTDSTGATKHVTVTNPTVSEPIP